MNDRRVKDVMLSVLVALIILSFVLKILLEKQLSLDGVHYFYRVLETGTFFNIAWSRRFAEYLIQWPLLFAAKAGITNVPLLTAIFGFGIFSVYLFSVWYSWYLVREKAPLVMVFPIASYLIIGNTGDYWFVGEHHVLTALTWPLLFLVICRTKLTATQWVILVLLSLAYTRLYETGVLPSLIIVVFLLANGGLRKTAGQRYGVVIVASLLVIGAMISVYYILYPVSGQNKGAFIDSITRLKHIVELKYLGLSLLLLLGGWVLETIGRVKLAKTVFLTTMIPVIIYVYIRFTSDYSLTAYWSFSSRTLTVLALPLLMIGAIWAHHGNKDVDLIAIKVFFFVAVLFLGANAIDQRNWWVVRAEMKRAISVTEEGTFLSISETRLSHNHHRFTWNNPLLGIVWSAPCVRAIILNSPEEISWEPFDPKSILVLTDYVKYSKKFPVLVND